MCQLTDGRGKVDDQEYLEFLFENAGARRLVVDQREQRLQLLHGDAVETKSMNLLSGACVILVIPNMIILKIIPSDPRR